DSDWTVYAYNNTIYNANRGFSLWDGTVHAVNNIIQVGTGGSTFISWGGSWGNTDYNLANGSGFPGTVKYENATADFISPLTGDFRLKSTDANAVGGGQDLSLDLDLPITTDINQNSRITWDLGAQNSADFSSGALWTDVGSGTESDPYLFGNKDQLIDFATNGCNDTFTVGCNANIILVENIDLSGSTYKPIGTSTNNYTGKFNGNEKIISNLTINSPGSNEVGFFGSICDAEIANVILKDVTISGNNSVGPLVGYATDDCGAMPVISNSAVISGTVTGAGNNIGGLAGYLEGATLTTSFARTDVTGSGDWCGGLVGDYGDGILSDSNASGDVKCSGNRVGGLVGQKYAGSITNSFALGDVFGTGQVGGLIGSNDATITYSYAHGNVRGTSTTGGFVGSNTVLITGSYSTGHVDGNGASGDSYIGGFVGLASSGGSVVSSYSNGNVFSSGDINGGFAGINQGSIDQSYSTGNLKGQNKTGGMVGNNDTGSTLTNSYSTGSVIGAIDVGGLVGIINNATITNTYSNGNISGTNNVGGLVGNSLAGGTSITSSYTRSDILSGTGQAFIGTGSGGAVLTNNYYDSDIESINTTSATGLTTTNFKLQGNFTGFTFGTDWNNVEGHGFPEIVDNTNQAGVCLDSTYIAATTYDSVPAAADGSQANPYVICNYVQLKDLMENGCGNSNYTDCDKHFKLGHDIDVRGNSWLPPIGDPSPNCFSGEFDGHGYSILNFVGQRLDDEALFGCVSGRVKNLRIQNAYVLRGNNGGILASRGEEAQFINNHIMSSYINGATPATNTVTGGLVAYMQGGLVSHSSFHGRTNLANRGGGIVGETDPAYPIQSLLLKNTFIGDLYGLSTIGGILGRYGEVRKSKAIGYGRLNGTEDVLGGIVGASGKVYNSAAYMYLEGFTNDYVGGIAGTSTPIQNSYSISPSINGNDYIGGLIGDTSGNVMSKSYSAASSITATGSNIGGLAGIGGFPTPPFSYFDYSINALTAGTYGKTTAEMFTPATTFSSWDSSNTWGLSTQRYPKLVWELPMKICRDNSNAIN
ncbi:hypothetical protein N9W41_01475, partial [bacterium]|nr:hypothetical protein [bacterium]